MNDTDRCMIVGRMCWPLGIDIPQGVAHASRLVCQHPEHHESAAKWVEEITGHLGVFEKVPADG